VSHAGAATLRRRAKPLLGTLVDIRLEADSEAAFMAATDAAFARIARIHEAMGFHAALSDVRAVARAPAGATLRVDADTWRVLRWALSMEAQSQGLFNAAVAPQLVADGLLPRPDAPPPTARTLAQGIALRPNHCVQVLAPVWLDLGGIAKGYAVDCAVAVLQARGHGSGLVNAGGDMRAFGARAYPVHLRSAQGFHTIAHLQEGALASSCHADGPSASPHIDPRRGGRVQSAQSVVVCAPRAWQADALTKVAMLCARTADRMCAAMGAQWRTFDYFGHPL
jgi:thiamine biosynthesis lipoprotein